MGSSGITSRKTGIPIKRLYDTDESSPQFSIFDEQLYNALYGYYGVDPGAITENIKSFLQQTKTENGYISKRFNYSSVRNVVKSKVGEKYHFEKLSKPTESGAKYTLKESRTAEQKERTAAKEGKTGKAKSESVKTTTSKYNYESAVSIGEEVNLTQERKTDRNRKKRK